MPKDLNDLNDIIDNAFSYIKDIVDANLVVGKTIKMNDNIYIIPISKISVGLISGGGNTPKKKKNISAGSGTGFNIIPIGFVTINNSNIGFLTVNNGDSTKTMLDGFFKIYEIISDKVSKGDEND